MRPEAVRQSLLQEERAKRIHLNDGTILIVTHREQWIVGGEYLFVLAKDGCVYHVAYRNIACIAHDQRNGRRARRPK